MSSRKSEEVPGEPWRKWLLCLLALGFALLVITLLAKENRMLMTNLEKTKMLLAGRMITDSGDREERTMEVTRLGACNERAGECLLNVGDAYYPQGLAVVEGYYQAYETTDWSGVQTTCDAFVITGGSTALLQGFEKLSAAGSGYIPKNSEGNFVMKINFGDIVADMTSAEREAVKMSTPENGVELRVFVYQQTDTGAATCQSPIAILEVE